MGAYAFYVSLGGHRRGPVPPQFTPQAIGAGGGEREGEGNQKKVRAERIHRVPLSLGEAADCEIFGSVRGRHREASRDEKIS